MLLSLRRLEPRLPPWGYPLMLPILRRFAGFVGNDPTYSLDYRRPDGAWRMWYKDEGHDSRTGAVESRDLRESFAGALKSASVPHPAWFPRGGASPVKRIIEGDSRYTQGWVVVAVQNLFPSQTFTLLNANGYVVAQRKSAVASKTTGRIVSLKVEEGSRVKKDEVIARLEHEDALAAQNRAQANVTLARAKLEQAKAEVRRQLIEAQLVEWPDSLILTTHDTNEKAIQQTVLGRKSTPSVIGEPVLLPIADFED